MNEFSMIAEYFAPLTMGRAEALGLRDDAAVITPPDGYDLVISTDTMNAGIHFPAEGVGPDDIARRALRAALSDLAAMGASPLCYFMNLALPSKPPREWLAAFRDGLLADQKTFGIFCAGGDTTSVRGGISITITVMGTVPHGRAVKRSGARIGDVVMISGSVGDSALGLRCIQKCLNTSESGYFINQFLRPTPRLDLAELTRRFAHAAIDISDGLVADLLHICVTSGVAARVEASKIPLSTPARLVLKSGEVNLTDLLTGGEDYQLLLAVPPANAAALAVAGCTIIGTFTKGAPKVDIIEIDGTSLAIPQAGWAHF